MKAVKFGIIGAGIGANLIASGLKVLEERGAAEAVAVTSAHEEKARGFANKWGISEWYICHREMFRKSNLDVVAISTPHYLHFPIALDAIEYGLHTLVDKPMTVNLAEADEMILRARRAGLKLGVILELRFSESASKVKGIIESGALGKLIMGEAVVEWIRTQEYYEQSPWRGRLAMEGGGVAINQAIHTIDLLIWFMGSVDQLWATTSTVMHNINVEDLAIAMLKFKSGALGVIQASTATYPGFPNRVEVHGLNGTAIIEGDRIKALSIKGEETISESREKKLETWVKPEAVPADLHANLFTDFVEAIKEDREPLVNGEEGRRSLEVVRAIYRSSREGKPVGFPIIE